MMHPRNGRPWITTAAAAVVALVTTVGGCGWIIGIEPLSGEELPGGGAGGQGSGGAPGACSDCLPAKWTRVLNGGSDQIVDALAIGPSGSIAFVGSLEGSADLDGECPPNDPCPRSSAGANDAFVAMLASDGKPLWSLRFGDVMAQSAAGVAVDDKDNTTVIGSFKGTIKPGSDLLSSAIANSYDMFIARFDPSGNHQASRNFGDSKDQYAQDMVLDNAGNAIVVGYYEGAPDFSTPPNTNCALPSANGAFDIFVVKLGPDLSCLWSKGFGTTNVSRALAVAVDAQSNVLITGRFYGTIDFGNGPQAYPGPDDLFVLKLGANGSTIWAQVFGDAAFQQGNDVVVDAAGNVYVTGTFESTLDFKTGNGPVLVSADRKDVFVAKLDAATGNALWSRSFGGSDDQIGEAIAVGTDGHVFVTGSMVESPQFAGKILQSAGSTDMFVLHYDAKGTPQCGERFGDMLEQSGKALAIDAQGLILGANFDGTLNLGCATATSKGGSDVMIMRLGLEP